MGGAGAVAGGDSGKTSDPVVQAALHKEDGNGKLKVGNFAEAERQYTLAIQLDPSVEAYLTNRALVRTKLNNTAGAVADCNAALLLNPTSARAFGRLGAAHFSGGNFAEAAEAYRKALELDKGNATYAQGLEAARPRASAAAAGGKHGAAGSTGNASDTADAVKEVLAKMGGAAEVMRKHQEQAAAKRANESINDAAPDLGVGMERSKLAWDLFEDGKADYAVAFQAPGSEKEKDAAVNAAHERTALKCLELARTNGGIYNKAAQFVASLQGGAGDRGGLPKQYVEVLEVLTDQAPFRPFARMEQVLVEDLGKKGSELFSSIDTQPIAAASLAQVHKARTKEGEDVAVKMLYPGLRKNTASDFSVFETMGKQIKPGGFDLEWLVRDFKEALAMELDLQTEAANAEEAQRKLARRTDVSIPRVLAEEAQRKLARRADVSIPRVLDTEKLHAAHLSRSECGELVSDVFYEMALVHGLVHGDPHAGNVYLRVGECTKSGCKPQLVMLDHGLYHTIPPAMRKDLCRLIIAQLSPFASHARRLRLAARFAGPLARYFPLMLSPWFVFSASLTSEDMAAARKQELPKSIAPQDIAECLVAMHGEQEKGGGGNMLGVLHGLLTSLDFSERARLKSLVRHAQIGLWAPAHQERALNGGSLPLMATLQLFLVGFYVDLTALLIPFLSLIGPLIFFYSLYMSFLASLWRFGGLNILAWDWADAEKEDASDDKTE
ncbi:ABC1 family-domain-containing protein [Baffinella frigidus]|nr:ABC1 family-domain-containing protein [Cryptophyta sp. CCMP2293]